MKRNGKLENLIRKDLDVRASDGTYDHLRGLTLNAHGPSRTTESASMLIINRRTIMRNPIVRLGIAAAIIAVVGVGIMEFIGTGSKSGVVWAKVAQKVEASQGVVFRVRDTGSKDPNNDWPNGYIMIRRSPLHSRTDWYRGGQVRRSIRFDLEAKTMRWVTHDAKMYYEKAMSEADVQSARGGGFTNPKDLVDRFLSGAYKKLESRTIDGVLCEGIETTDPAAAGANYPIKSFTGRIWVSVATGYPMLVEEVATGEDGQRRETEADQFQWDVEVGARECEVPIPSDYRFLD